jgi:hypothetical protein
MNVKEEVCDGVDWIELVQEKVQWRAVVNAVIKRQGNFVTS